MKLRASHFCVFALVAAGALVAHVRGDITGVLGRPDVSSATPVGTSRPIGAGGPGGGGGAGVPQVALCAALFHVPPPAREALLRQAVLRMRE